MHKFGANVLLSLSVLALGAEAIASPKVLSIPFQKRESTKRLAKRAGYITESLNNYLPLNEYYATVTVGTPPQTLELIIDTGSSDIWFFGVGACDVQASGGACEGGEYDSSNSSTYDLLAQGQFKIQYVTQGSGVVGDYITDTFGIGGATVKSLTMAVATSANQTATGIMGIGLDSNEAGGFKYQNLPDVLVNQSIISTNSYSLYLDDLASGSGQVIFGGYDKNKFTGDLIMLPLQTDSQTGVVDSFAVAWTSISLTNRNGTFDISTGDLPAAAILDSGTTLTYLPQDLFDLFAAAHTFDASYSNDFQAYLVSCSVRNMAGQLNFGFGGTNGPVISVPFAELATPAYNLDGEVVVDKKGDEVCVFGLQPATDDSPILFGQTFLRSAYVMYDLDNLLAGLAPTVFDSTTPNIVEYSKAASAGSVTTDTSGPTVTLASAADNTGVAYSIGTSASLTDDITSAAASASATAGSISISGNAALTSLRSYPTAAVPTREAASLGTGAVGAVTGSVTGAAASSTGTGAAAAVRVPGFGLGGGWFALGTVFVGVIGGMLAL